MKIWLLVCLLLTGCNSAQGYLQVDASGRYFIDGVEVETADCNEGNNYCDTTIRIEDWNLNPAPVTNFDQLRQFEMAVKALRLMGEITDLDAQDMAHAHYMAANVSIALDDIESYERHITQALEYLRAVYESLEVDGIDL